MLSLSNHFLVSLLLISSASLIWAKIFPKCEDKDMNCYVWVAESPEKCEDDEIVVKDCKKACGICEGMPDVDPSEFLFEFLRSFRFFMLLKFHISKFDTKSLEIKYFYIANNFTTSFRI